MSGIKVADDNPLDSAALFTERGLLKVEGVEAVIDNKKKRVVKKPKGDVEMDEEQY